MFNKAYILTLLFETKSKSPLANLSCLCFSSQHVQKLRKNRDTTGIVTAADPASGASKASATPRKAAATPRKRRTPAKKDVDEDDDMDVKLKLEQAAEDEEMYSPSIRASKRARSFAS